MTIGDVFPRYVVASWAAPPFDLCKQRQQEFAEVLSILSTGLGLREPPKIRHKELASQRPKARELSTKADVLHPAQCLRDLGVPMGTWTRLSGDSG